MSVSTEALWHDLGDSLRGFIRSRVRDPHIAEDLLQDVFLRIHENIDTLKDEDKVTAWVYRIARNAVVDHARRVAPDTVDPDHVPDPRDPIPAQAGSPEDRSFINDLGASVRNVIHKLPPKYAEAMELVELQGMSQKELAQRLGLSLSGAKSRVQRGRELIRAELLACCHLEFDQRGRPIHWKPREACGCC